VTVLVVDDHRVVADAIAARLRMEPDIDAVMTANTLASGHALVRSVSPDVVVVDAILGDEDGLDLVREIKQHDIRIAVVVVTGRDTADTAIEAVRAGADSFLSKCAPAEQLVRVVRGVCMGETHIPPRLLTSVLQSLLQPEPATTEAAALVGKLTAREREILEHMVAGQDRATMARELYLSVNTVRTHTKNILAKLKVHSTLEAVGIALTVGIRPRATVASRV
jgi:DNA-binding NarL/FixJ family response regulator